ncbi:MAG TPA: DNA methyltransferase [Sedimentisphaerales bacterium]|nr:DNA methyltransferase [Sedimentisphaerales bacterium]
MVRKSISESRKTQPAGKPSVLVDTRVIYCGDNLDQLKKFPDECIDLIYIDPPFNSNRNYEVFWGETKEKRSFEDRHASTQAYIEFMRPRCLELHRVLKKTGSFYFHCDWHASHYVKIMLDQIFGENQFRTEIIWRRTNAKGLAFRSFPNDHDTVFYYTQSSDYTFNRQYIPHTKDYVESFYKYVEPDTGRRYRLGDLTNPNKDRPNLTYEFLGIKRVWRWTKGRMQEAHKKGLVIQTKPGAVPALKRYLDEQKGNPVDSIWGDIPPIQAQSAERLGYPTQKPLALLDRIIKASSNPNDIVLDAFCGCGTALVAAENLGRQWVGIDISPTACRVMAKRLRDVCGLKEDEKLWRIGRGFVVRDLPWTEKKLRDIPPFEFENWAVIALGGIPNKAQVGDMGIDGRIYPVSATPKKKKGELDFMDVWYPIQVKQKEKVGRPDIDSFEAVMMREDRNKGFFVSFDYSADAISEIQAFFKRTGKSIIALTVKDILDEQIAYKLV